MDASYTFPKLRWPLDVKLHSFGKDDALMIRCPIGIAEQPLLLNPAVGPLIAQFDGVNSVDSILNQFSSRGLTPEILQEVISLLDKNLFLANARFFAALQSVKETFEASEVRQAALAGLSYPNDRLDLQQLVRSYLVPYIPSADSKQLFTLIAPHIDYRRGGKCYGEIYPRLADSDADLYILIGTAHQYSPHIFHLCAKDFVCPLGTLSCDREFISQVAIRYGAGRSFADQLLHRREHSLELQLPFLSLLKPTAKVAPILVGSFHTYVARNQLPDYADEYASFAGALAECIQVYRNEGKRVCFLAGVDMAHVGRSFGDSSALTPEKMQEIAVRDYEYLGAIKSGSKEALFNHISSDQDARRICGFPTLYTILDVTQRIRASFDYDMVSYAQAVDYKTDCAVTFAGIALYEQGVMARSGK